MARHLPDTFAVAPQQAPDQSQPRPHAALETGLIARMVASVAVIAGLGLGTLLMLTLAGPAPERLQQDAALAGLVRTMVAIKGLILAAALALVVWRLGRPVSAARLAGYAGTLAVSAAALGWMWSLNAIPVTAPLFYGGLIACYLIAARDRRLLDVRTES
ncbi:hypothetical protein [Halochromatium glycolicum]|nr:hypothetical protein [Halochromatium glycolicum]